MNKIMALTIAASSLVIGLWAMPTLQQKANANWSSIYQCGSGNMWYGGKYWYYQNTCQAYYYSGNSGFVEEVIQKVCYWYWNGFGYTFAGCNPWQVVYYCNPNQLGRTCGTF